MPTSAVAADTPHYVLLDENRRIGPNVVRGPGASECAPIYGFSDKGLYERFRANSQLALTPYPLVKVYLQDQTRVAGEPLKLVVLDAEGPRDDYLRAATMTAVLEAHESRANQVTAAYQLTFDPKANAYRIEKASE